MLFHKTCPKRLVIYNDLFSPLFSFQSKQEGQHVGNKYYILIFEQGHQLEHCPHCSQQRKPMEHICNYKWSKTWLACVKATEMLFNLAP
jgi:hypothetical protein